MKHEFFDLFHISHIIVSMGITVLLLFLAKKFLKKQRHKDIFLKIIGITTLILHLIPLWFNFLRNGETLVVDNMLFPIYFCNLSMFLLFVVSLIENKQSKIFKHVAIVVAYSSIIGALVTLVYPDFYFNYYEANIGLYKSFLSHDTMLLGGLYLIIGGYVKVENKNTLDFLGGLLFYGLVGVSINFLFIRNGLPTPNAMYLNAPPIEEVPLLNVYVIALLAIAFVIITQLIYGKMKQRIDNNGKYLIE